MSLVCAQEVGAVVGVESLKVLCLCAEWCGTCREYRVAFDALAAEFPDVSFGWVDIEDHADLMGDLDIENFPTLLIGSTREILFFGTMLPQIQHLRRTIETFLQQSADERHVYARKMPDRAAWQDNEDLTQLVNTWSDFL